MTDARAEKNETSAEHSIKINRKIKQKQKEYLEFLWYFFVCVRDNKRVPEKRNWAV